MDPAITGWNYASRDLEVIVIARSGTNNINILPRILGTQIRQEHSDLVRSP